ncbi:hypothetical protein [Streptomyces sp. NPDC054794]
MSTPVPHPSHAVVPRDGQREYGARPSLGIARGIGRGWCVRRPLALQAAPSPTRHSRPASRAACHVAPAARRKAIGEIRNESVVNMHFGHADTAAAPPGFLHRLDRRGLRAVTTRELLS